MCLKLFIPLLGYLCGGQWNGASNIEVNVSVPELYTGLGKISGSTIMNASEVDCRIPSEVRLGGVRNWEFYPIFTETIRICGLTLGFT